MLIDDLLTFQPESVCSSKQYQITFRFFSQEIPLQPGSKIAETWVKPPIKPIFKLYFFNITNPVAFVHKGAKPNLKEVGPYTYR